MHYTEYCITVETERMLLHLPLKKDFQDTKWGSDLVYTYIIMQKTV